MLGLPLGAWVPRPLVADWLAILRLRLGLAVEVEQAHIDALAEGATYRHLLLEALQGWHEERVKRLRKEELLDSANERIRQLTGMEPWHHETDDEPG